MLGPTSWRELTGRGCRQAPEVSGGSDSAGSPADLPPPPASHGEDGDLPPARPRAAPRLSLQGSEEGAPPAPAASASPSQVRRGMGRGGERERERWREIIIITKCFHFIRMTEGLAPFYSGI